MTITHKDHAMNHTHYQELTSQFIDHELGPEDEKDLFVHLGTCDECRRFLKAALMLQGDILGTKPVHTVSPHPARTAHVLRAVWSKRIPMPVAAMLAVIALASTVAFSTLWMRPKEKVVETKQEVVYVSRLPAIQVVGFYPPKNDLKK
jgi:predicted anti-sigma-YlaC factor YlaD